eukprot:GHVS01070510.1.p1 GENE.GHVS01070510.1~~GHVS01070510.1.p1  ORF type:complete len:324 (+),score=39.64 GHVS01070510.1:750-1721(+)
MEVADTVQLRRNRNELADDLVFEAKFLRRELLTVKDRFVIGEGDSTVTVVTARRKRNYNIVSVYFPGDRQNEVAVGDVFFMQWGYLTNASMEGGLVAQVFNRVNFDEMKKKDLANTFFQINTDAKEMDHYMHMNSLKTVLQFESSLSGTNFWPAGDPSKKCNYYLFGEEIHHAGGGTPDSRDDQFAMVLQTSFDGPPDLRNVLFFPADAVQRMRSLPELLGYDEKPNCNSFDFSGRANDRVTVQNWEEIRLQLPSWPVKETFPSFFQRSVPGVQKSLLKLKDPTPLKLKDPTRVSPQYEVVLLLWLLWSPLTTTTTAKDLSRV